MKTVTELHQCGDVLLKQNYLNEVQKVQDWINTGKIRFMQAWVYVRDESYKAEIAKVKQIPVKTKYGEVVIKEVNDEYNKNLESHIQHIMNK